MSWIPVPIRIGSENGRTTGAPNFSWVRESMPLSFPDIFLSEIKIIIVGLLETVLSGQGSKDPRVEAPRLLNGN